MSDGIDRYVPGRDEAEILSMRASVWGAGHPHGTPAFYAWLFERNPAGRGGGVLIRKGGELIGFAGGTPRRLRVGTDTIRVAHGLDYMVAPAFRGRLAGSYAVKLASAWAETSREDGHAFGINFPNANSVRLLTSDRLGWTPILRPSFLVRPLPGLRFTERPPGGLPPFLANLGGRALAAGLSLLKRPPKAPPGRIVELDGFDARFDALWHREAERAPAAFLRDAATLSWRYTSHPAYRYRILAFGRGDEIAAYLVASPRSLMGLESLLVVDGWAAPSDTGLLAVLAADLARRAAKEGVGILGAQVVPGSAFEGALRKAGFLKVPERLNPKPFVLVGLPLAGAVPAVTDWHVTWGDMDVV